MVQGGDKQDGSKPRPYRSPLRGALWLTTNPPLRGASWLATNLANGYPLTATGSLTSNSRRTRSRSASARSSSSR